MENVSKIKTGKIENLFRTNGHFDKKHKLNTTNKNIPLDIIESIEKIGITSEQINELISKGYDIYRYGTQITLHGICKELTNDRIFWYKCLVLNKNKSIGIKWIAIDRQKRLDIISKLKYFGFSCVNNSTELYPCKIQRFNDKSNAIKYMNELKDRMNKIDENLFFGYQNLFLSEYLGMYFVVYELFINGIFEKNIDTLLEQIIGMNKKEIEQKIAKIEYEKEQRYIAWNKKYNEQKEIEQSEYQKKLDIVENELIANGYKKVLSNTLPKDTIFIHVGKSYDNQPEKEYFYMTARTAKKCNADGKIDYNTYNYTSYKKYKHFVWVK